MTIKNMSIGNRLGLGFALVLLALTVSTGIGIYRLQTVANATHAMMNVPLAKERMISDWQRYLYGGIRRTTAIAKSSDPSLAAFFASDAQTSTDKSLALVKKIDELADSSEEKALLADVNQIRKTFTDARDQVSAAKKAGDEQTAERLLEQNYLPAAQAYENAVQKLVDHQRAAIDESARNVDAIASTSRTLLVLLAIFAIGLGIVCAWLLTRSITLPVGRAVAAAKRIAEGDLSDTGALVRSGAATRDEAAVLLDTLRVMNANLGALVRQVRGGTESIAMASTEIATGNLDLSARTEQQAASLQETSASMSELTATVKQNLENARQANQIGTSAVRTVEQGSQAVGELVTTVNRISESSGKIADIISLIEGIAFQTNILALNAAVEAARAGEQGRGFAVVASEVRSLAQRSSAAAKEIKALIEESVETVGDGVRRADEVGRNMAEVKQAIRRVADLVGEITAASDEQARGIEQVDAAVTQMDAVTQQNAALVEEAAAAAQSMDEQARKLKVSVEAFRLPAAAV